MNFVKLLFMVLSTLILFSCTKESSDTIPVSSSESSPVDNYREQFAIILSKAIYENKSLCDFLKASALKQFDKDYDVFYPFVKDCEISEGKTFRDILLSVAGEDYDLRRIEISLPQLNIYIPNWSIFDAFSVESWDTDDPEASVGYQEKDSLILISNGEKVGSLSYMQFSEFPILIINDNDRMKILPSSRSGEIIYDFIDPEFDAALSLATRVDHTYYDRTFATDDYSNWMSSEELPSNSVAVVAYNTFKNNPLAAHRDNIYYGMDNSINKGILNPRIYEYIAKFKFANINCDFIFDDSDFYGCPESYTRYKTIPDETILKKFYFKGNLELYFQIFLGNRTNDPIEVKKLKSVSFSDVFQLAKVHVDFKHKTWLSGSKKWVYTWDLDCFIPKWYDADIQLPRWDISENSTIMNIAVSEYDSEKETTSIFTVTNSFTDNFTNEGSVSFPIGDSGATGSEKVGYGLTSKEETSQSIKIIRKEGADDLGTALLYYDAPIIESSEKLNGKEGYRVHEINTGYIYMLIVPKYY